MGTVVKLFVLFLFVQNSNCVWNCGGTGAGIDDNAQPVFEDITAKDLQTSTTAWAPLNLDKQQWKRNETCPQGEFLRKLNVNEDRGSVKFTIKCGNVTREDIGAPDELVAEKQWARDEDKKPVCRGPMVGFLMQWNGEGKAIRLQMECAGGEFAITYEKDGTPRRQRRNKCSKGKAICGYTDFYTSSFPSVDWFNPVCCQLPPEFVNVSDPRMVTLREGAVVEAIGPLLGPELVPLTTVYCPLPNKFPVKMQEDGFVGNKFQEFDMPCNQTANNTDYERDCAWAIVGFSYKRKESGAMADIKYECDSGAERSTKNPTGIDAGESKRYRFRCSDGSGVCGFLRNGPHNLLNLLCCPLPKDDVNWDTCQASSYFERINNTDDSYVNYEFVDTLGKGDVKLEYDWFMFEERKFPYTKAVMRKVEEASREFYPNGLKNVSLWSSAVKASGEDDQVHQLRIKCGAYEFRLGVLKFSDAKRPSCKKLAELKVYYCRCLPSNERPENTCDCLPFALPPKTCKKEFGLRLIRDSREYTNDWTQYNIGIISTPPGLDGKLYNWNAWSLYEATRGLLESAELDACKNGISIRDVDFHPQTVHNNGELMRVNYFFPCIYQLFLKCGDTEVNFNFVRKGRGQNENCDLTIIDLALWPWKYSNVPLNISEVHYVCFSQDINAKRRTSPDC